MTAGNDPRFTIAAAQLRVTSSFAPCGYKTVHRPQESIFYVPDKQ